MLTCVFLLLVALSAYSDKAKGEDGAGYNVTFSGNLTDKASKTIDSAIFEHRCNEELSEVQCDGTGKCLCPESRQKHYDERGTASPRTDAAIPSAALKLEAVERSIKKMFSRRNYALRAAQTIAGIPPDSSCFSDSDCAGYPLSYCDGVCKCAQGTLNAGSTCISAAQQTARTCPKGQTYVSEAGICMTIQLPGEPCQYSQQCAAAEPGAYCSRLK